jgi:hypothetical protein
MLVRCAVAGIAWVLLSSAAHAQVPTGTVRERQDLINWYYAATFGTGVYTAGDRSVSVFQLPFSHAMQTIEQDGIGLRFKLATTFGFYDYDFDNVLNAQIPDRLSTFSILPGVEWEIPLTRRWAIRPYVDAGYGREIAGSQSALIYDFGVKSRFLIARDRGVEFALVNSLTSAGYRPGGGSNKPFGYLASGVDITIPTERNLFGQDVSIGFTPVYYYYFNRLRFSEFSDPSNSIREEFQLALSIIAAKSWSLKFFEVDRIGLSLRSSGDVTGVSLFTSLPF